jgi:hypothetical protein
MSGVPGAPPGNAADTERCIQANRRGAMGKDDTYAEGLEIELRLITADWNATRAQYPPLRPCCAVCRIENQRLRADEGGNEAEEFKEGQGHCAGMTYVSVGTVAECVAHSSPRSSRSGEPNNHIHVARRNRLLHVASMGPQAERAQRSWGLPLPATQGREGASSRQGHQRAL